MNKKTTIIICIYLVIWCSFCCSQSISYSEISKKMSIALKNGYAEDVLSVAEEINEGFIKQKDGLKFLKLKVSALCLGGDFMQALTVINENSSIFSNEIELIAAQGILSFWLYGDDHGYFKKIFELFYRSDVNKMKDSEKLLYYYIMTIVSDEQQSNEKVKIRNNSNSDLALAMDMLDKTDKEELIKKPPLGFISYISLPKKADSEKKTVVVIKYTKHVTSFS